MHFALCIVTLLIVTCMRDVAASDSSFKGFTIPCKDTSPKCVKDSFQVIFSEFALGIPSLGIEPSDPFIVDKVNFEMPGGLFIEFNNGQTKGFRKCSIISARVKEDEFNFVLQCNFTTKGKYRSYGKMLMFPIDGNGDSTIVCKNLRIDCSVKIGTKEQDGKKYLMIKEHHIKHSYQGQVFYKITNLFKGNPEISDLILEFMNRNWHAVAKEFGDPIINYGVQTVLNNVEKLIQAVPVDQLIRQN